MSKASNFFPMLVRLTGRKCLVVGGGEIAAEKIAGLLIHGAQVEVVSPRVVGRIQKLVSQGKIVWRRRKFSSRDLDGAFLAVAATNSSIVNQTVFRACNARDVLCNAVDDPVHCDFFYPAVVRRGPLQIAISTSGQSPALAARLRRELEMQFGPEWSDWVEHVGKLRREILEKRMSAKARRRRLLEMASPDEFQEFMRRGSLNKSEAAGVSARGQARRPPPHKSKS